MGFLLGALSRQMAGKRVRSLQARMVRVQSQLRRATRDIEQRERYWNQIIKNTKNSVMSQSHALMAGIGASLQNSMWGSLGQLKDKDNKDINMDELAKYNQAEWEKLNAESAKMINTRMAEMNQQNARVTQALQASLQQTLAMHEQDVEMAKEADMQVLKDLEDDLQTEKDSLETQIKLAEKDYEESGKMVDSGVKNLTPSYTGQS